MLGEGQSLSRVWAVVSILFIGCLSGAHFSPGAALLYVPSAFSRVLKLSLLGARVWSGDLSLTVD